MAKEALQVSTNFAKITIIVLAKRKTLQQISKKYQE